MEKLADRWGRQIRYGEPPDEPERVEEGGIRRQIIRTVINSSEIFAIAEKHRVELGQQVLARLVPVHGGEEGAAAYRERVIEQRRQRQATKDLKMRMEDAESELRLIFENALKGLEEEE